MNPLQLRLAILRRRLRLIITFRGVCTLLAILLLAAVATGLLDWRIPGHLPSLVRAVLLVGTLSLGGLAGYRYLLQPLCARADDLSLALRVEAHYPTFKDSLASAVQFLEQPAGSDNVDSPSLRRQAVNHALDLANGVDFNSVADTRGVRTAGLSLAVAATLALALTLLNPPLAWTALARLAYPFGGPEWPRQTRLEIRAPSRVARGEAVEIRGNVQGVVPERARVAFRFDNGTFLEQQYGIRRAEGAREGTLIVHLDADRVQRSFRFQVQAHDAVTGWNEVTVLAPPQLVPLSGRPSPQIHLQFPTYTDLAALDLPDGASSFEAPAGTQVHLRAAVDRPVVRAWLEYPADLKPTLTVAALLNSLRPALPTSAVEWAATRSEGWKRIAARLENGGRILDLDFMARLSGTFALHFEDELGIGNTRLLELHTLADPAPLVHLERPSRSRDSLDILPDAEITLQVQAQDVRYAIRSVYLEYRRKQEGNAEGQGVSERLPLYDHAAWGQALPQLLAGLARPALLSPLPSLRLRPARFEIERRWPLKELNLKEGDILVLQACADDFDDVTVGKKPGRSQEAELRVVSHTALEIALNAAQAQVQQELLRLHKQQQEALAKVIPAETYWRNRQGPLPSKHLDELLQAEQLQQQIQARVGNKQEGLRADVGRILQTLQDNHLSRTGTKDRMEAVAAELDRLAREELSQVEPKLTEARKQSELAAGRDSALEKKNNPLTEARKHQEEVEKTLRELLKLLEPWSSTREVKGEAQAILQEQRQLAKQTAQMEQRIPLSAERNELKPAQKAELEQAEESQRELAERAGQLLQKLKRLAADRAAREPEMAKQLGEAASRGDQSDVSGKMREAEQSLRRMQLARAGREQQDSARAMEEVVKALEDRRDEDLDRLIKRMREAEQQLADLAEQQDKLRAKAKAAGEVADPGKREKLLKRLAREQERLQRKTQEMVRELSRLRGERAAQTLSQANADMQRAGRQMDKGENSDEQQRELLDRLNEARRRLQETRAEAEEELAREKLAKLADQIKGLRQRQESLLAESARIQRELLQHKQWVRPLQASQRALSDAERGLGEETERLAKEKLEGAKVFAHLLTKAAEAMQRASTQMLERLEKARQRLDSAPAAEDPGLDLPAEQTADSQVQELQRAALRRIDRLLDALKPDVERALSAPADRGKGGGPGQRGGGGGNPSADRDPLPPLGQLKALRALQQEVNERTKAFAKQHPDSKKLNKNDREELQALGQEQVEIADLFQQLTAPAENQGEKK
jgi:hypothetical protein